MLFIITGLTGELGQRAEKLFCQLGLEIIKKQEQKSSDDAWNTRASKTQVSKEESDSWDFKYKVDEKIIGFKKEIFFDAINGKTNGVLTVSAKDPEIIREIKSAYDSSLVKTIFVYIEESSLVGTVKKYDNVTEAEIKKRVCVGHELKRTYLENIEIYDNLVIYDDQEYGFGIDDALNQLKRIIEPEIQKSNNGIACPYKGNKPYLFVSYAHNDKQIVLPIIESMRLKGYRIWYDEGIKTGSNWQEMILDKVSSCKQFILFSSESATKSKWVNREIGIADDKDKPIIRINIDNSKFKESIECVLNEFQYVSISDEHFVQKLYEALAEETKEQI